MMPILTLVRLGKWEEILQDNTVPDPRWPYAGVLYHFARGLAFVYTGKSDSAAGQLSRLRDKIKDPILTIRDIPFNTPLQGASVAEGILNGALLFSQEKYDTAINVLKKAIQIEDGMIYREPRDWPIPARQFLGVCLLKLDRSSVAESIYREDLVWNPGNGWSLLGLYNSLQAQHKKAASAPYKAEYLRSFSQADRMPSASVFME
jgi:tetratricopeptide (TPR) repeat protein